MKIETGFVPISTDALLQYGFKYTIEDKGILQSRAFYKLGDFEWDGNFISYNGKIIEHIEYLHQFETLYSSMTGN